MHTDVPRIDAALVERLIAAQFPEWADLPVREVDPQGWDNRTYRLGDALSVRLPSAEGYVAAVEKEQDVLPYLARRLDVAVPEPVGLGEPGDGYPFPWSVRRWLDGTVASRAIGIDHRRFAEDVGAVLRQLRSIPATGGPVAGAHSFHRGGHPSYYGTEVVAALDALGDGVDREACEEVWERAIASRWEEPDVWFHGDVAPGNLLVTVDDDDGGNDHGAARLSALIDFGTCGVGDPACDLVLAWTFLDAPARRVFHDAVGLDADTWGRARGWALWKSLIMLAGSAGPGDRAEHEAVLAAVLADPVV
ncbi:aminoglycoside phosphotransferase family protein [Curtobacterium sp. PhB115]|uniref:aminoglycoside phosphotransferase family protein n=1 Tax=Curtobacterium sp. PhB115 TaxID=2485173 RepID=UPI000F4B30DD|nr:aminoglycoside phosphotransferase family protein [Curtobacterium sp. PhB115]ROP75008.1 aminoglycoside phosphotransferase (APT) family kinase protein [Curtobacterium sp. PhB115]